jgi:hypothetical protein
MKQRRETGDRGRETRSKDVRHGGQRTGDNSDKGRLKFVSASPHILNHPYVGAFSAHA